MAKRDFDIYFNQIKQQYLDAVDILNELGASAKDNMVSEDQIKQTEQFYAPIFEAYKFMTYIKFLLDKPNRNSKKKLYENRNKKIKDNEYTKEKVIEQNKQLLDRKKEVI